MLMDGGYRGTAVLFPFSAVLCIYVLQKLCPEMYILQCHKAWGTALKEGAFISPGKDAFINSPADSIDYAVMEHTRLAAVRPLATNWNDLGLREAFPSGWGRKDDDGMSVHIRYCAGKRTQPLSAWYPSAHCRNRCLMIRHYRDTSDSILYAPRASVQSVKHIVARPRKLGRPEHSSAPLVYRPGEL